MFFWAGANTNIIREKLYLQTKSNPRFFVHLIDKSLNPNSGDYYSIEENKKYKYLLNMNGHSYGGRLNYLFLTGSCVIVLKNKDKNKVWEEYFYRYFKPNVDYIEVEYAENELDGLSEKIEQALQKVNPEEIAHHAFVQAKQMFQMNEIYNVIYNKIKVMSHHWAKENPSLEKSIFYTSKSPLYLYSRIYPHPENTYTFHFQGVSFDILFRTSSTYVFEFQAAALRVTQNEETLYQQAIQRTTTQSMMYTLQIKENEVHVRIHPNRLYSIPCKMELPLQEIGLRTTEHEGWWVI
jgi:hypothetical protein